MTTQENDAFIAYFAVHPTEDRKGFLGGMLVIDSRGVPQEFQCTLPARPTAAQRALYGNTLESYLFTELIGVPLVNSLNSSPNCVIVGNRMLLGLREHVETPVIHLEKYGESLNPSSGQLQHKRLESSLGGFQPITANTYNGYTADYESVREMLEQIFNHVDLLEPFERISTSFEVLSKRDSKFR